MVTIKALKPQSRIDGIDPLPCHLKWSHASATLGHNSTKRRYHTERSLCVAKERRGRAWTCRHAEKRIRPTNRSSFPATYHRKRVRREIHRAEWSKRGSR